jgi:hypothetical protein
VRRFECFTADLHRLAGWLQSCGVETVALQSTNRPVCIGFPCSTFWKHGFEVYLVNAQHTTNLPGWKSAVQESQWLLKFAHLRIVE